MKESERERERERERETERERDSGEKKILVPGNAGDEKNLYPGGRKLFFLINLTDFLSKVYTYRTILTALFFFEKQAILPFIVRRKKRVNSYE